MNEEDRKRELISRANRGEPLSEYEIADLFGVSRTRIWQIHQRALKKLRKALEAEGNVSDLFA